MDGLQREILKELFSEDKEVLPVARRVARGKESAGHVDHWSPAVLLERAAYLRKMAKHGDGSASETLREYPQHIAMLSFRSRSGEAEVHEKFADLFYVLAGTATLITGGVVQGARVVGLGETRGRSIEGGTRQKLRVGDLAHVSAGTPHQMLLTGEEAFTCTVIKVQEV